MNSIDSLKEKFTALVEEQRKLQEKFQKDAQAIFKETIKGFFDKNPGINALVWTQYTPYFNDGDTCEFSVGDVVFTNASEQEDLDEISYDDYSGENESVWVAMDFHYVFENPERYWNKETIEKINAGPPIDLKSCKLIGEVMSSTEMEGVLGAMFGDHVKVIATREGFDVQDFEHN